MLEELGISGGTAIIVLIAWYFVTKWAVRNGIKEAYSAITGKETAEDLEWKKIFSKQEECGNEEEPLKESEEAE